MSNKVGKENKESIVICGFPGIGKTEAAKLDPERFVDLDSCDYHYTIEDGETVVKDEWPYNYVKAIKELLDKKDGKYILISCHTEVRRALVANEIPYMVVAPDIAAREAYIKRFLRRHNSFSYIMRISDCWMAWCMEIDTQETHPVIHLDAHEYLYDIFLEDGEKDTRKYLYDIFEG